MEFGADMGLYLKQYCYNILPPILRPFWKRIETSEIGSRLAKGIFWSIFGSVISRGLTLCATVLVARMLGKTVYGELGMIQSTVGMFGVFAGFGLGLTATKYVAEFRQSDQERTGRILALSGIFSFGTGGFMAITLLIFAPWLAEHTINAPHLVGVLRVGALLLFINALNGAQTGALAGFEAFKTIAHVNILVGMISFPILIFGAFFNGLSGVVCALAANLCISWLFNHLALRKLARRYRIPFTFRNCNREWSVLWRFSLPATLGGIMVAPVQWLSNAIVVSRPNGYGEIGMFTAALVFQQFLLVVNGMLGVPLLSMLSNVGTAKSKRLESANILSSWLLGLLPALPLLCFPEIIEIIYGGDYVDNSFRVTFSIIIFYTCILTYRSGLLRVLQSKDLLWLGVCNNLLWAAVLLPAVYFLSDWGAVGLAVSYAISYVSTSIVFVPVYIKYCNIPSELLVSKETVFVWFVIILLAIMSFFNIPILYRAFVLPFALCLTGLALRKIWLNSSS